jgi:integrase/recombinase XerD
MNFNHRFRSVLAPAITDYLKHMRSLGRGFMNEEYVFRQLDAYLGRIGGDLNSDAFTSWCLADNHLASGVRRSRMRIVRNMCLYWRRTHPTCFVPDLALFPARHQTASPHIFSEPEIIALLHLTESLPPTANSPLLPQVYRLAVVLLYTTGLRRSELVRLSTADYEPYERT